MKYSSKTYICLCKLYKIPCLLYRPETLCSFRVPLHSMNTNPYEEQGRERSPSPYVCRLFGFTSFQETTCRLLFNPCDYDYDDETHHNDPTCRRESQCGLSGRAKEQVGDVRCGRLGNEYDNHDLDWEEDVGRHRHRHYHHQLYKE